MLTKALINSFLLCLIATLNSVGKIDEQNVLEKSREKNQPIVAIFLGSDCPWSAILQQEVLESPFFLEKMGSEAILWPILLKQSEEEKTFLQQYQVQKCPSILILDPHGKEFARFEYLPLDAAGYAEIITAQIDNFHEICLALDQINDDSFDEEKWRDLYLKAKKLSASCFKQVLLEQGFRKEEGSFFHFEKYTHLLDKYKSKHPSVRKAKKQLLDKDPENKQGYHFKVAALEFQKLASRLKKNERPERALKPLLKYIQTFGKKDPENYWKSELIIAEFLYKKNLIARALEHASAAYSAAPDCEKAQIAETVSFFQRQ